VGDASSILLLLEDFVRIYERLSNGKSVSLPSVSRTFVDFITERASFDPRNQEPPPAQPGNGASKTDYPQIAPTRITTIYFRVKAKLFSEVVERCGWQPADVLIAAVLRCLGCSVGQPWVGMDVIRDYRRTEATLTNTPGPLMDVFHLSPKLIENTGV